MLISKETKVIWGSQNKKWYVDKGYVYTKSKDEFIVKVEDLMHGSHAPVMAKCDYCTKEIPIEYSTYLNQRKTLAKDCCFECNSKKRLEIKYIKDSGKTMNEDNPVYWTIKKNRITSVKNFIVKHNTLNNIKTFDDGKRLYVELIKYHERIWQIAIDLGYDLFYIMDRKPNNYYNIFETLEKDIKKLVKINKCYPTQIFIKKNLHITNAILQKHGGYQAIRSRMGYPNDNKFIDLRGDSNKSEFELIVANYLCSQGLKDKYTREQYPFPSCDGKYRSDFSFILENEKIVQCEVWGFSNNMKNKGSKISIEYNKTRKIKENLYQKHNISLISLNCDIFLHTYEKIIKILNEKFKDILGKNIKDINYMNILPECRLTEDEIMKRIMVYSDDKDYIPTREQITNHEKGTTIYTYMVTKFGGLNYFANKYNKKMINNRFFYWNDDKVNERFLLMINKYGKILSRKEIAKEKNKDIRGIYTFITTGKNRNNKSIYDYRLTFYEYCIKRNIEIGEIELEYLRKMSGRIANSNGYLTQDNINFADRLYNEIINKQEVI